MIKLTRIVLSSAFTGLIALAATQASAESSQQWSDRPADQRYVAATPVTEINTSVHLKAISDLDLSSSQRDKLASLRAVEGISDSELEEQAFSMLSDEQRQQLERDLWTEYSAR